MAIAFLAPEQALWGLVFVVFAVWLVLSDRKVMRVRRAFMLQNTGYSRTFISGFLLLVLMAAIAAIAARPVTFGQEHAGVRKGAAVAFLFDASESMAAEPVLGGLNRLARAKNIAQEIAQAHPDVPMGVYAFTDILVSHLPVSSDRQAIRIALSEVVEIGSVPVRSSIQGEPRVITTLQPLFLRARAIFPEHAQQRILVVFSDGDFASNTRSALTSITAQLQKQNIHLVTVTVGNVYERIPEVDQKGARTGRYVAHIPFVDEGFMHTFAEVSQGISLAESDADELNHVIKRAITEIGPDDSVERTIVKDRTWWFAIAVAVALTLLVLQRFGAMGLPRRQAGLPLAVCERATKIILHVSRKVLFLKRN